jgi:hypothetical protein
MRLVDFVGATVWATWIVFGNGINWGLLHLPKKTEIGVKLGKMRQAVANDIPSPLGFSTLVPSCPLLRPAGVEILLPLLCVSVADIFYTERPDGRSTNPGRFFSGNGWP